MTWSDDHRSVFDYNWLLEHNFTGQNPTSSTATSPLLWNSDSQNQFINVDFHKVSNKLVLHHFRNVMPWTPVLKFILLVSPLRMGVTTIGHQCTLIFDILQRTLLHALNMVNCTLAMCIFEADSKLSLLLSNMLQKCFALLDLLSLVGGRVKLRAS